MRRMTPAATLIAVKKYKQHEDDSDLTVQIKKLVKKGEGFTSKHRRTFVLVLTRAKIGSMWASVADAPLVHTNLGPLLDL